MTILYASESIAAYLDRMDNGESCDARGTALEDLIVYLFEKVPGISTVERDVVNHSGNRELDNGLWNSRVYGWLDFLENTILVECKNWAEPTGSNEIRDFRSALRESRQTYGVLVAASGVTGHAHDLSRAHHELESALSVDGIRIVVIRRSEIELMSSADELVSTIKLKLCQLIARGTCIE